MPYTSAKKKLMAMLS